MNSNDEARDRRMLEFYAQASHDQALAPSDAVRKTIIGEGRRIALALSQAASAKHRRQRRHRTMTGLAGAATILVAALVIAPKLRYHEGQVINQPADPAPPKAASIKPESRRAAPRPLESLEQRAEMNALSQRQAAAAHTWASEFAKKKAGPSPALFAAATSGDTARAATLLGRTDVVDARDDAGRTPLLVAAANGRIEMVRLLLAHGADPNVIDETGNTPLKASQQMGFSEVAAALIEGGAH